MSWVDKAIQKNKMRKQVEEVLNSPEYKNMQLEMEQQATLNALGRFTFFACGYLETRHGYKKEGLKRFLAYILTCLETTQTDELFFLEHEKYFKEQYGLDVLSELGLGLEKK